MHIYADADALPNAIKEILCRAAIRLGIGLTLVANKKLHIPQSQYITTIRLGQGFDVVDAAIVDRIKPGDLVITADIPLAALIVEKDAHALNPRGELYTKDNIQGHVTMRNLLYELRGGGVVTGGPRPLCNRDREAFANQLDIFLTRHATR
ncbi:YaiI/YqxD family protein [Desulfolutivibrio sulfoxidireducens]|uniref:YaiI/YqxD family protein n=1 Tax=Desulfolutivibrio sulfoxidireducens TaxID=2773299 RepID=UPI00159D392B|nr:YaiI/YqxD family protein [Desulfolutivibrio sulfoxidireducens]QLA16226.1 YaiI/YqxD family protein [Desulfolutivibrio sulfoxidireducens]